MIIPNLLINQYESSWSKSRDPSMNIIIKNHTYHVSYIKTEHITSSSWWSWSFCWKQIGINKQLNQIHFPKFFFLVFYDAFFINHQYHHQSRLFCLPLEVAYNNSSALYNRKKAIQTLQKTCSHKQPKDNTARFAKHIS